MGNGRVRIPETNVFFDFVLRDWYRHNMFGDGWISILRPI
jgi:hypothetical protein